jgi:site-specific DNA recombinase
MSTRALNPSNRKASTRTAIYARISKARDDEDTAGVDRQVAECEAYAEAHGLDVVGHYVDNSQSAMTGRRPEYRRLLADVEAGLVDVIVAWSADRLYRRMSDLEQLVDTLGGTRVETVKSGDIDLTTADGRMVARLLGSVAQREAEKMSERIVAAAQVRASEGRKPGGERRFGYAVDGRDIVPAEAERVREAARRVIAGDSLAGIARDWKAQGVKGATGGTFSGVHIGKLLRRAHYAGLSVWHGSIVGTLADHPPILTPEQHHQLVAILDAPSRTNKRGRPGSTMLGEVCTCAVCGTPLAAQSRRRGTERILTYSCRSGHVQRDRVDLDASVGRLVVAFLSKNSKQLQRTAKRPTAPGKAEVEADRLRQKLAALPALLAGDDGMDPLDFAAATRALRDRLRVVERGLARSSSTPTAAALVASGDVMAAWDESGTIVRRAVVREVVDTITVGRGVRGSSPMEQVEVTLKLK